MNPSPPLYTVSAPEELSAAMERHLRDRPEIARALRLFEMSLEEYQKALGRPETYTSSSSNAVE